MNMLSKKAVMLAAGAALALAMSASFAKAQVDGPLVNNEWGVPAIYNSVCSSAIFTPSIPDGAAGSVATTSGGGSCSSLKYTSSSGFSCIFSWDVSGSVGKFSGATGQCTTDGITLTLQSNNP